MRSFLSVRTKLYSKIKIFFNNRSSNAPTEPASERQEEVKDDMAEAGGSNGQQSSRDGQMPLTTGPAPLPDAIK